MRKATDGRGRHTRRLVSLVVALWLTGAGCLFCCGGTASAAHAVKAHSVTGDAGHRAAADARHTVRRAASAAAGSGHDCCRAKLPERAVDASEAPDGEGSDPAPHASLATETELPTSARHAGGERRPSRARVCCVKAGQTLDAARKPRPHAQSQTGVPARLFSAEQARSPSAAPGVEPRERLPDRGGTYLRVCVFLI